MHTSFSRAQSVFSTFTTVVMVVSVLISLTAYIQLYTSGAHSLPARVGKFTPKVTLKNSRRFGSVDGKNKENARVAFDLETDLSPLFNWNTKQVFVYLTADYPGKRPDVSNRVTFWDKIVTSKDDAKLAIRNGRGSYSVYDHAQSFGGREATIHLEWNVQPYVGALIYGETIVNGTETFVFPSAV